MMLDSKCLNISLLEVMISSNNEGVSYQDLYSLTVPITFDVWWVLTIVGSQLSIGWWSSNPALAWRSNWRCGSGTTGILGIICIACHQVICHLPYRGICLVGKKLLVTVQIRKLIKWIHLNVTEWSSSTTITWLWPYWSDQEVDE
jgi:hypothetical protein